MSELPEERAIVKKVVQKLGDGTFETYLFEEDAIPGAGSPQDEWRRQLERTFVMVVLLYQKFGEYTEEEIWLSRELGIPVLLLRKKDKEQSLETAAPEFVGWLQDAETGVLTKWFDTPKQLKKAVKEALRKEINAALGNVQRSAALTSVDGMTLKEGKAPDVGPRSEPRRQLPRQKFFVGRDDEKQQLLEAIEVARESEGDRYIVLVGPPGIGKEALLRHLTHSGDLPEFPDGTAIAPDWIDRGDLEDLLQALWEQFYDPGHVVDPRQRNVQLGDVEALVFLVGLDDAADIRHVVERIMPKSVFCGTVVEFDMVAEPLPVDPLTDDEEICAIFEKIYGSGFPDSATRTTFAELCRRQGGNPGKIEFLGKQAKLKARPSSNAEAPHPLVAWVLDLAREEGSTPPAPLLEAVASEIGDVRVPRNVLSPDD